MDRKRGPYILLRTDAGTKRLYFAGAGAERSTTDRPSDAPTATLRGRRAHPTAPAIPYVALPEGTLADLCSRFPSESISIEHYDPIL